MVPLTPLISAHPSILLIESDEGLMEHLRYAMGYKFPDVAVDYCSVFEEPMALDYHTVVCGFAEAVKDHYSAMKWCARHLPSASFVLTMRSGDERFTEHARTYGVLDAIWGDPYRLDDTTDVIRRALTVCQVGEAIANRVSGLVQYKLQLDTHPGGDTGTTLSRALQDNRSRCAHSITCIEGSLQAFRTLAECLKADASDHFDTMSPGMPPSRHHTPLTARSREHP